MAKEVYVFDLNGEFKETSTVEQIARNTSKMGVYQAIRNKTCYQKTCYLSYNREGNKFDKRINKEIYQYSTDGKFVKKTTMSDLLDEFGCVDTTIYKAVRKHTVFAGKYILSHIEKFPLAAFQTKLVLLK